MSSGQTALSALRGELGARELNGWLVGGAVRDQLLGRPTLDYDVVVEGDVAALAKAFARRADAHPFQLSGEFGTWRIKGRVEPWQIDITAINGPTLEADLRARDLTINAIAQALAPGAQAGDGELIDPLGGARDVQAKLLRAASEQAFSSDPLRVVRLARFSAQLAADGFRADPATVTLAAAAAGGLTQVAAERVFQELRQLISSDQPLRGLEQLETTGAMQIVLPELHALRGVEQSDYHHRDVYGHTLLALEQAVAIERDPERFFPGRGEAITASLAQELASELTRGHALRFGSLLHDIAKPLTRAVTPEGRVTFFDHDVEGARIAAEILTRLRASDKLVSFVAALTRNHLRLGFLVHKRPLPAQAVYDYLRASEPVGLEVTLLSVADRLATLGRGHERAGQLHLELAREMLDAAIAWNADPPSPPLRGDQLAAALGIEPGPILGQLLAQLTRAAYAGEIVTEPDAIAYARASLSAHEQES